MLANNKQFHRIESNRFLILSNRPSLVNSPYVPEYIGSTGAKDC